jgi:hypothetical protein
VRRVLVIAAASFALLATGCSSGTTEGEAPSAQAVASEAPAAEPAATEAPAAETAQKQLPVKGAPRNGGGIVYHRSDCSYGNVRFYGFGGDGPGSACGTWALAPYQRDIIHSFDWNFRTEDLTAVHINSFVKYQEEADYSTRYPRTQLARSWEQTFFEQVNRINGGTGNAFTDLINNNLPGLDIKDGRTTPGRSR